MARFRNRLFAVIAIVASVVATLGPLLLPEHAAAARPCPMAMDMSFSHGGSHTATMPNCFDGVSCMIMIALPATSAPSSTLLAWVQVQYTVSSDARAGVTVSPDPSPPKSHA